mmetsp:Transcript_16452/g.22964  ORF Transcript_16452/g.22964 Transcript_16452/m.22964 type:complete len:455 (-) Transcript_16452:63-1427(-)|eukprot:CAMPEP_0184489650 /NCGR_PEP_ID=MMETSP0113_2-20130426/16011_1 /TAXON_ID=91329 /ORGANISM="Norrisiella sphaerica, Strain BC52" /LENGTH=454 /DNA_ID=CAMNT_0026873191 /DNA_START=124 /DNA_END=1488 /DNA_ORIENTATION=-
MTSFGKYRLVAKKGEGTFSEVIKAQCMKKGQYVAIKCMKTTFDSIDQVNSLREIQALRRLNPHPNIIELLDVLYDRSSGRLALVFELFDMNIYELIRGRKQYLGDELVKIYMHQLVTAIAYMHRQNIFHRDIKPENVLVMGDRLKLADFGSCRGIYSKPPFTEYISTRWYRAPESLLTNGYYDYKMDLWGVGCVMFEIISLFPLFPGTNELDQIEKIHTIMGTPSKGIMNKFKRHSSHIKNFNFPQRVGTGIRRLIPHASKNCIDLVEKLLVYDPDGRTSASQALRHPYFYDFRGSPVREGNSTAMSPKSKSDRFQFHHMKAKYSEKYGNGRNTIELGNLLETQRIRHKKEREKRLARRKNKVYHKYSSAAKPGGKLPTILHNTLGKKKEPYHRSPKYHSPEHRHHQTLPKFPKFTVPVTLRKQDKLCKKMRNPREDSEKLASILMTIHKNKAR